MTNNTHPRRTTALTDEELLQLYEVRAALPPEQPASKGKAVDGHHPMSATPSSTTPHSHSVSISHGAYVKTDSPVVSGPPLSLPPVRQVSPVADRVQRLSAQSRRMEIVWPVVNFSLFLLVIASIAGGGIFAVQYGVNRWSENRIDSRQNEQIVTERSGTSSCVQPSAFPPPVSNEMVKTRLDRTSLQSAPGIACPTKGMLHNRDLLVPLSGEVLVGGEAWIFVRVFDATGVLPEPVEGWVPAEELVPAE